MKFVKIFIILMFFCPFNTFSASKNKDQLIEQLMIEGINLGYAAACYVGGTGDYDWLNPTVKICLRKKYGAIDEITYQGILGGAIQNGVERAKSSSSNCENMLNWLALLYKKCGVNTKSVQLAKKGFLEKRKKIEGY